MMGRPDQAGGQAAHSRACFGPTLVSVVYGPLLSEFRDFRDRIPFRCHGMRPHTCFLFIFMHNMWIQTHIHKEIESR